MDSVTEVITLNGDLDKTYHLLTSSPPTKVVKPSLRQIDESFARVPSVEIDDVPGSLPRAQIPADADLEAIAANALGQLNAQDTAIFAEQILWRDVFALTGTLRTFHSASTARVAWADLNELHHPYKFTLKQRTARVKRTDDQHSWIHAGFTFETRGEMRFKCSGWIGIVPEGTQWKVWLLCTVLEEIVGLGSPDRLTKISNKTVSDLSNDHAGLSAHRYDCVIVGSGFGGLCVAGRLKALGVNYLVIDQQEKIGDNWMDRYDSARCTESLFPV